MPTWRTHQAHPRRIGIIATSCHLTAHPADAAGVGSPMVILISLRRRDAGIIKIGHLSLIRSAAMEYWIRSLVRWKKSGLGQFIRDIGGGRHSIMIPLDVL